MAFSNTKPHFAVLLPILLTCFLLQLNKVKSSDSISFNYTQFGNDLNDIILQGDAITNGILLLTPVPMYPAKDSAGRALFSSPIRLWESSTSRAASFSTSFSFSVDSPFSTIGDGLTFFIAPVDTEIPSNGTGGNLAVYGTDAKPFVAVEFDTFQNDWDPPAPHIGVDINNVTSVITSDWNTPAKRWLPTLVRINYDAATTKLSVSLTYPAAPTAEESTLSYNIALKDHLPEWVKVGISGSTGDAVEYNRVVSWSFSSNLVDISTASKNVM